MAEMIELAKSIAGVGLPTILLIGIGFLWKLYVDLLNRYHEVVKEQGLLIASLADSLGEKE